MNRKSTRAIPAPIIAIMYAVIWILPSAATPALGASLNGDWNISRTGRGCTPKTYITVSIKGRKISGSYIGGTGKHRITGSVSSKGSFRFTAQSPRDRVMFSGNISGKSGRGKWHVSGKQCGGSLRIFR